MLVLSRKPNERIMIGDNVVGIDAPKEIRVLRGELRNATLKPTAGFLPSAPAAIDASGSPLSIDAVESNGGAARTSTLFGGRQSSLSRDIKVASLSYVKI